VCGDTHSARNHTLGELFVNPLRQLFTKVASHLAGPLLVNLTKDVGCSKPSMSSASVKPPLALPSSSKYVGPVHIPSALEFSHPLPKIKKQ